MFSFSFESEGIKYLVSPYERDAQIALLLKHEYVDIAITEDSDLLVYGCEKVHSCIMKK